ncbi:MAG: PaaI family thioesterase [Calditrichaeota bacterium]|nr:PaaI family thioesterase [Calditrichota bacterium]
MTIEHFQKLERMYLAAPCNRYYQPKIAIRNGETDLAIAVQPEFFHAAKAVHGSVYFKALDDSSFFAVNSLVTDVFVLTISLNLYFLRPVNSGHIRAVGKVIERSKRLFTAESTLYNDKRKVIARSSGQFMRSTILLDESIGYK